MNATTELQMRVNDKDHDDGVQQTAFVPNIYESLHPCHGSATVLYLSQRSYGRYTNEASQVTGQRSHNRTATCAASWYLLVIVEIRFLRKRSPTNERIHSERHAYLGNETSGSPNEELRLGLEGENHYSHHAILILSAQTGYLTPTPEASG